MSKAILFETSPHKMLKYKYRTTNLRKDLYEVSCTRMEVGKKDKRVFEICFNTQKEALEMCELFEKFRITTHVDAVELLRTIQKEDKMSQTVVRSGSKNQTQPATPENGLPTYYDREITPNEYIELILSDRRNPIHPYVAYLIGQIIKYSSRIDEKDEFGEDGIKILYYATTLVKFQEKLKAEMLEINKELEKTCLL